MSDLSSRDYRVAAGTVSVVLPGNGDAGTSLESDYNATLVGLGEISYEKVEEDNTVFPSSVDMTFFDPEKKLWSLIDAVPTTVIGDVSQIPVTLMLNGAAKYNGAIDLMTASWDKNKRRATFTVSDQMQILKTIKLQDENNGNAVTNPLGYTTGTRVSFLQMLLDIFKAINPSLVSIPIVVQNWSFLKGGVGGSATPFSNIGCVPFDDIFNNSTALSQLKTLADVWKMISLTFQARSGMLDINTPYFVKEMVSGQVPVVLVDGQVKSWRPERSLQSIDPIIKVRDSSWTFDTAGGGWGTWTNAIVPKANYYTPMLCYVDGAGNPAGNLKAVDDGTAIGGMKDGTGIILPGLNPSLLPPYPYNATQQQYLTTFYNLAQAIGANLITFRGTARKKYIAKLDGVDYSMAELYTYGDFGNFRPLTLSESLTKNETSATFVEMPA